MCGCLRLHLRHVVSGGVGVEVRAEPRRKSFKSSDSIDRMDWLQEAVGTGSVLSRTDDVSEADRFAALSGFVSPSRRPCSGCH